LKAIKPAYLTTITTYTANASHMHHRHSSDDLYMQGAFTSHRKCQDYSGRETSSWKSSHGTSPLAQQTLLIQLAVAPGIVTTTTTCRKHIGYHPHCQHHVPSRIHREVGAGRCMQPIQHASSQVQLTQPAHPSSGPDAVASVSFGGGRL
jgi:hypothetical protein